jgi:hypothetical protein
MNDALGLAVPLERPPLNPDRCQFPGLFQAGEPWPRQCEAPPAPSSSSTGGARPRYCVDPEHTAARAYHERKKWERAQARAAGRQVTDTEDLGRPVSLAGARARDTVERLELRLEELRTFVTDALDALRIVGDPDAVEAQLEAVQADAQQAEAAVRGELSRELQRRLVAEQDMRTATEAAEEMHQQLVEALEQARLAREAATAATHEAERAGANATAAAAARDEALAAQAVAVQALEQANRDRDAAVGQAEGAAERERHATDRADRADTDRAHAEAREREAVDARGRAEAAAAEALAARQLAEERLAAAEQLAVGAQQARQEARERARTAESRMAELQAALDQAETRERAADEGRQRAEQRAVALEGRVALAEQRAHTAESRADEATGTIATLRAALDAARPPDEEKGPGTGPRRRRPQQDRQ